MHSTVLSRRRICEPAVMGALKMGEENASGL
jgi:hypothetical protein